MHSGRSSLKRTWVGFTVSEDSKSVQRSGIHKAMWLPPLYPVAPLLVLGGLAPRHILIGRVEDMTYTVKQEVMRGTQTQTCQPRKQTDTCAHQACDIYMYAHKSIHIKVHTQPWWGGGGVTWFKPSLETCLNQESHSAAAGWAEIGTGTSNLCHFLSNTSTYAQNRALNKTNWYIPSTDELGEIQTE